MIQNQPIESLEPIILLSASPGCADDAESVQISDAPGQTLSGSNDADTLIAFAGFNQLWGESGDDVLVSAHGSNQLYGGDGTDTAVYWADQADFSFLVRPGHELLVHGKKRTDVLKEIEYIQFDDGVLDVADVIRNAPREYRTFDGWGNNLHNPHFGSSGIQLLRFSEPDYSDQLNEPAGENRVGVREISNMLSAETETHLNSAGLTDIAWLWGQFVDHDIDLTEPGVPAEPLPIDVPEGDPWFDPAGTGNVQIPFDRSAYDPDTGTPETGPRQQINQITAFLDGSMIYGSDESRADALREFEGGRLKTSEGDLLPFNDAGLHNAGGDADDLFVAGDIRANENVALSAMHTLWVREHNRLAEELAEEHPDFSDEELYQRSRERVIAEIQAITFNEFLPAITGDNTISEWTGYNPDINPGIANEFSTAAYRFGHSMLPAVIQRLNDDSTTAEEGPLPLRDAFFAPQELQAHGLESILKGVTAKRASEIDLFVVDEVRNFLFGPPGAGGFDLVSLNIQRGRDHGLPDYNQVRTSIGLSPVSDFSDITSDTDLQDKLQQLYESVDDIDLWVGVLAEDHIPGAPIGETLRHIIIDQFSRLRDGDRFWYENVLEPDDLQEVQNTTLSDIIRRNTNVQSLPENVFVIS